MSDEKIIHAIMNRDEAVMGQVMNQYTRLLWSVAAAVLSNAGSVQDVEECVADAFIYLWQYPEKYLPSRGKLSSWLCMVTRSKSIDRYRQLVKLQEVYLETGDWLDGLKQGRAVSVFKPNGNRQWETHGHVWDCVNALKEPDREMIIRRYFHEQKIGEIALAMDIPKKNVENHLYQAKQKLKKMLQ